MVWRRYLTLALCLLLLEPLGYGKVHLLNERVHLVEGPEGSGNKTPVSGSEEMGKGSSYESVEKGDKVELGGYNC